MASSYFKLQDNILSQIVKSKGNYKKTPKDRLSLSYVETRLENLEKHWNDFTINHTKIVVEVKKDELESSSYIMNDVYSSTEEYYIEYKALLKDQLKKLTPVSDSNQGISYKHEHVSVKLPKIEIPKFSGQYSEWASFRDLFTSLIHKNNHIDNVQKLHYLKSSVTGEAELLLRHIPVTSDNYTICWSQLESRYNNKKFLANCILKKLTSQKALTSESSAAIKHLLDTTRECLYALQNLGVDTSSWDIIVIFLVSQKLDPVSRKLWEQKATECSQELPTLTTFEIFLENHYRSIEFLDPNVIRQTKSNCLLGTTNEIICHYCSGDHKLANCRKFATQTTDERRSFALTQHLCFNCLNTDHNVFQCNISTRCRMCKRKHHSLLHPNTPKSVNDHVKTDQSVTKNVVAIATATPSTSQSQSDSIDAPTITSYFLNTPSQVLLATALVNAESPTKGTTVVLRSLIDQGSQASFVTESTIQLLGLKRTTETNLISGLGGDLESTIASKSTVMLSIQSRLDPSFKISVKAHVLKKLTCFLPRRNVGIVPQIASLELADPSFGTPNKIDLLLGAEVYSQIIMEGLVKELPGSLIAQNTRFGWILSGKTDIRDVVDNENANLHITSMHLVDSSNNDLLKRFWEMESEPSFTKVRNLTPEEQLCETFFSEFTRRDEFGRYIVKLPFKSQDPLCKYGNSKEIARKRFYMLEKRLLKNPELRREYSNVINEYLQLGHMEAVSNPDKSDAVYLPHHAIVRQDKITSRVRVVFDASCSGSNGISLNDDLMIGPSLQPELRHLVMRWRRFPIALVADIVKMYRQVKVSVEDTDFQRIYWRENVTEDLQQYRLLRVTFGTSPAPYLAVKCLQQLAHDEGADFPLAADRLLSDFYMDDFISGSYSVDQGLQVYDQMTGLLNRGGFPLQKWSSNNHDLMSRINKGSNTTEELELRTDEVMKILGLTWNRKKDTFYCTVKLPQVEIPITKRRVLSDIARLFDPLGWLAPAITTAKVFIQKLWLSGIEWDEELPLSLLEDWISYRNDLSNLSKIYIPRWINSSKEDICFELHGFSDASNVAYAAVVYARIIDKHGQVHVSLITAKTRVAPIKQVSIPRLELCGAVLLSKLLHEVAETLDVPKHHLHAWTDSSIVLAWLRSHPSRWKTFVANRTSEILTYLDSFQWSHVSSENNPADCASRGLRPSEYVEMKLWNQGPEWLYRESIDYQKGCSSDTVMEEKRLKVIHNTYVIEEDPFLERFSSLRRLLRVLAWCRRFYLPDLIYKPCWLTYKELEDVKNICIKRSQDLYFDFDLSRNNKFSSLNPFKDNNGIWRIGGRLLHANLTEDQKHPILIPRQSHVAKLIIADAHDRTLHGGPQLMINYIHTKYWIISLRNLVKSYIHKCVTCIRYSSTTINRLMGQLPMARVTTSRPFLQSGLDYAGPIAVRTTKGRGHKATKGYICLFVCMSTRAIHIEVVSDLTSEAFLAAFKRFVSRRGHCSELWSDNATTFVGADRELKTLQGSEISTVAKDIVEWLATNGTVWHRIPPYSPNFGGLWEAGIKSTKSHLKRVIGDATLTFEELSTVLAQIEACLNSRPIARSSLDSDDAYPLTPGHFLVGEPLLLVPDANYERSNINSLKRWQLTQKMVQGFWRRWSNEYLTQFLQRHKWKEQTTEPNIGDIVLVKEDNLPPARWLYGIIVEKHSGMDNVTRVVSLRCKDTIIKRPVTKIVKLPVTN